MEGPSLLLASDQLLVFKGKKVILVSGNSKIDIERLANKKVLDVFSWGKHLVLQFDSFALRTHFMLFGTYEATIEDQVVTGDYQRTREPRLALKFKNGEVKFFNCSLRIIETTDLKSTYDFTQSIMSSQFNKEKAFEALKQFPTETIDDALLDQDIFAGVGNIIKNEVLFLEKINPHTQIQDISSQTLKKIIHTTQTFSFQFYEWRKQFVLRKHLQIYHKKQCPICNNPITREKTGKRQRWSYYCPQCQLLK